ncbi:ankyrin repeat-containing domain protein [Apodospora peruviana]|uniref:Ankyrin repeat-containing domain protein n=1 Tax=Apodospora peruviana TaxID=516989 RepID=A0AAE0IIG9_9PEZI|nr:ankyrin repeat-containing domain protein [Apodospora peruviana]
MKFSCTVRRCNSQYGRSDNLLKHMRKAHKASSCQNSSKDAYKKSLEDAKAREARLVLLSAADAGSEPLVQLYLDSEFDVNQRSPDGRSALHVAAAGGQEAVARLLLSQRDIEVDVPANDGRTPLSYAAREGHEGMVELILSKLQHSPHNKGVELNSEALTLAQIRAGLAVVKLLLEKGVKPSSESLRDAVFGGNLAVVKLLLEEGVEPDSNTLSEAVQRGRLAVVNWLLEKGVKPDSDSLSLATKKGNITVVNLLLEAGVKPDSDSLSSAAYWGNVEVARLLLDLGLKPDSTSPRSARHCCEKRVLGRKGGQYITR